jgi:Protein of unknown function (DUF2726)
LISLYLLLVVIPVAVIAYIVWDHKRKAAAREAASAGRLQQILGASDRGRSEQHESVPVQSSEAGRDEATRTSVYARRKRVLDPSHTLVYYLLRTALPDYVILVQVPLTSILEPAPGLSMHAREESLRALGARMIDFLVSDRNMQPVAVVQLVAASHEMAAEATTPGAWFSAAGVRHITLDVSALPKKDAIRGVVLDENVMATRAQPDATSHAS